MMMLGEWLTGEAPFHTVYLHGIVRDPYGQKMSKTKGNVVDPLDLIDDFGADALRFTLALAAGQSRDMRIGPSRVEVNRNFGTKLWNAARFCEMNDCRTLADFAPASVKQAVNQWIVAEVGLACEAVKAFLVELRFNEAAGSVYHFVYDVFCDWYLEIAKPIFAGEDENAKAETRATAAWARDMLLKLLHPFMPFITEELWARTAGGDGRSTLLIASDWPAVAVPSEFEQAQHELDWVIDVVKGVRSIRAEMNVPPAARIALIAKDANAQSRERINRNLRIIRQLARLDRVDVAEVFPIGTAQFVLGESTIGLPLGDVIDFSKERTRLEKELKKAQDEIARFDAKLSNEQFVARAPEDVLSEQREKRSDAAAIAARLMDAIGRLG
jgi:valyl-tRNA synthetase